MKWMICALLFVGLVLAAGNGASADVKENMLQARHAQMECRANFMYHAMENAEGFDPDASLVQERAQLQEQIGIMQQYATEGNYEAFNQEMVQARNAYATAMQGVHKAHQNALEKAESAGQGAGAPGGMGDGAPGTGISENASQMRDRMLQQHQEAQNEYAECMKNATRSRVHAELASFDEWHGNGQATAAQMKQRGYDTSALEEILGEAEGVSEELESDVNSTGSYEEMAEMRRNAWKKEFYLWTEFHAERFGILLDRMDVETNGKYSAQTEQIRNQLASALQLSEGKSYGPGEAAQAKQMLNNAAQEMRGLLQEMSE